MSNIVVSQDVDTLLQSASYAAIRSLLGVESEGAPFNAGNISGSTTFNYNSGGFQKATLTGNVTLNPPSNGREGVRLRLWLTPSGTNRELYLSGIKTPSDSALTFPKTLIGGQLYVMLLQHNGTSWMLLSLVGGYIP